MILLFIPITRGQADVRVFVEEDDGLARVKYKWTAGEVVRAFALDVIVDQGRIIGISDFFAGESTESAQGHGIFPTSFRDRISFGSSLNWDANKYTPLAVAEDHPEDTLPGLGSSGVTLEFGGLWDSSVSAAVPPSAGTLCSLRITRGANVSVNANLSRGGVVAANPNMRLAPVFSGTFVQPPEITGLSLSGGLLTIRFEGGELQCAPSINGPWIKTGNTSGVQVESYAVVTNRFFRVRSL